MNWTIKILPRAFKSLKNMDKPISARIKRGLVHSLAKADDPRAHPQVKSMQGVKNLFRYRVGDYRVLFRVLDRQVVIIVVNAGHRSKIYKQISEKKRAENQDFEFDL